MHGNVNFMDNIVIRQALEMTLKISVVSAMYHIIQLKPTLQSQDPGNITGFHYCKGIWDSIFGAMNL